MPALRVHRHVGEIIERAVDLAGQVEDLAAVEVVGFHSRKLVFVKGSEGVTIELVEWQ